MGKIVCVVAWVVCLLSIVASGILCGFALGVHGGVLQEQAALMYCLTMMVAGLTIGFGVTGLVRALERPRV